MTPVVSGTSPIRYLVQIGEAGLLERIYGEVIIPSAVHGELTAHGALPAVRSWATQLPAWIKTRDALQLVVSPVPGLHRGELAAISLAHELGAALLVDDRPGRTAAQNLGVTVTGTIGVLVEAGRRGLASIDVFGLAGRKSNNSEHR